MDAADFGARLDKLLRHAGGQGLGEGLHQPLVEMHDRGADFVRHLVGGFPIGFEQAADTLKRARAVVCEFIDLVPAPLRGGGGNGPNVFWRAKGGVDLLDARLQATRRLPSEQPDHKHEDRAPQQEQPRHAAQNGIGLIAFVGDHQPQVGPQLRRAREHGQPVQHGHRPQFGHLGVEVGPAVEIADDQGACAICQQIVRLAAASGRNRQTVCYPTLKLALVAASVDVDEARQIDVDRLLYRCPVGRADGLVGHRPQAEHQQHRQGDGQPHEPRKDRSA